MAADKQYIVKSDGAGQYVKGDLITEEQAGLWFKKWLGNGGIVEASAEEIKAAGGPDAKVDEPGGVARSFELATGDQDAVSPPPSSSSFPSSATVNKGIGK